MENPTIVILDGYVANPGDLSWLPIEELGSLTVYDETPPQLIAERAGKAEIVIVNKTRLRKEEFDQLPGLRLVCLLATGMDNVEVEEARKRGIEVKNAVDYSTPAVAQHFFALLLELTNHVALHSESVHHGEWTNEKWCYWKKSPIELEGKILGIYGFGKIGRRIASIALAFGMKVLVTSTHGTKKAYPEYEFVETEELFAQSDILSLNTPATPETKGFVDAQMLNKMKPTALLINTARGTLINEMDLKAALDSGRIAGAAMDVLSQEPPPADHPLLGASNCLITPHLAWAARESRERLIEIVAATIRRFLAVEKG